MRDGHNPPRRPAQLLGDYCQVSWLYHLVVLPSAF
jgi:hypothetical protein